MQVSIYSNGSQECERAASLLKSVHLDEVVVYERGKHFTEGQFRDEFGDEVEYPMISIGMFRGTLKETMKSIIDLSFIPQMWDASKSRNGAFTP
jgi:hypothetical protein